MASVTVVPSAAANASAAGASDACASPLSSAATDGGWVSRVVAVAEALARSLSIPVPLVVSPFVVGDLAIRNKQSSTEEDVEDAFAADVGEALVVRIGVVILILAASVGEGMEAELLALLGCDLGAP